MTGVVFCDPPRRGHVDDLPWLDIADALLARPGEWARVAQTPKPSPSSTLVSLVKKGRTPLVADDYEARSARYVEDGHDRWGVWLRYVGPVEPDVEQ